MKKIFFLFFIISATQIKAQVLDSLGCTGVIGDIKYSVLSPEKFQQLNGNCWILSDGRQISSSTLASIDSIENAPDYQGVFIRGMELRTEGRKDSDRLRDDPVGQYQHDAFKSHNHKFTYDMVKGDVEVSRPISTNVENYPFTQVYDTPTIFDWFTERTGDNETRPKNATAYTYIRIN